MLFALCLDLPSGGLLTQSLIPPRQRVFFTVLTAVFLGQIAVVTANLLCEMRIHSCNAWGIVCIAFFALLAGKHRPTALCAVSS